MTETLPAHVDERAHALTAAAEEAASIDPATVIEQWLGRLTVGVRRKYVQAVRELGEWALEGEPTPEDVFRFLCQQTPGVGNSILIGWRDHLRDERDLANGSVNGLVSAISSLLKLGRHLGLTSWAPEGIGLPNEPREDRSGPSHADVREIVRAVEAKAKRGELSAVRDVAAIRLLHGNALRRAELTSLRMEDLQLDGNEPRMWLLRKGKRERIAVHIPPKSVKALRRWIEFRGDAPGAVFIRCDRARRDGEPCLPISGESVRQLLRKRAAEAGVSHPTRPHGLRHSSATTVAATGSVARVMAHGGWTSMSSASKYLDDRDSEQRKAATDVEV